MLQSKDILITTSAVTGPTITDQIPGGAFQAVVTGTGAVAATAVVQASLTGGAWLDLGTITLSGTDTATDGFVNMGEWLFYRANCTGITGTNAKLSVAMSIQT